MICAKKSATGWFESCLIENQCVCNSGYSRYTGTHYNAEPFSLNSLKLNLDPHFPDLNKCVPERECPSNKPDMEEPGIPEDMPSGIQLKYDI